MFGLPVFKVTFMLTIDNIVVIFHMYKSKLLKNIYKLYWEWKIGITRCILRHMKASVLYFAAWKIYNIY